MLIIVLLIGLIVGGTAAVAVLFMVKISARFTRVLKSMDQFVNLLKVVGRDQDTLKEDARLLRNRMAPLEATVADLARQPPPQADATHLMYMNGSSLDVGLEQAVSAWERILNGDD